MLRALVEHWRLKLLALLLALALWFFVGSAERTEIALALPVEYVGLEGPLTLDGPRREMVDVQIQASRWAAAQVSPSRKLVPEPRVATPVPGRYPGRSAP